ncbi:hypothetical protein [Azonexus sp.]|uniref:hypothetical protein n=1 Tax=Azonexus sp. TaxID=1872668 RepID=UPI0039E3719D
MDYNLQAAEHILVGSKIPKALWKEIADAAVFGGRDSLLSFLGCNDFDWPWFDEWKERFEITGEWPEAWVDYEYGPASYKKVSDVLRSLTAPKLRSLARDLNISIVGVKKVAELRFALVRKVKWAQVADIAAGLSREAELGAARARVTAKRTMLAGAIAHRANNLYRYDQIVELLSSDIIKWRVCLDDLKSCPVAKKLAKGWSFPPENKMRLPPLFPGDWTGIRTQMIG